MLHPSSAPRSRTLAAALALSLVFHLALLVAIAYHAFTWFKLFPLTMPPVVVGGKKVRRTKRRVEPIYYLFLLPSLILFTLAITLPGAIGIFFSFTNSIGIGTWEIK